MSHEPLTVLSLFDGMSCGHLALDRAWIKVGKYFAAEIKKDAITVTQHNYPDTVQLWSVTEIKWENLPKIDILIGWSPCQWFSIAGKRLNFDDHRSVLFFEYLRLLKELKPKYFLLENVKMDKTIQDAISKELGVEPININSSLVSPALRNRFYWTNIPGVEIPKDRDIKLQDILTSWFTDRLKARAILESESRPLRDKARMYRRYKETWFTTIVFEKSLDDHENIRYFTQEELEACQTVPKWYTSILNRNQAAWLLWDWWTVDTIAHIFSYLKKDLEK